MDGELTGTRSLFVAAALSTLGDALDHPEPPPGQPTGGYSYQNQPAPWQGPQPYPMGYPAAPAPGWQSPYQSSQHMGSPGHPPSDKSVGAALVLSFFFGPLGVFYASILGGLILSGFFLLAMVLAVVTFGVGLVLLLVIWPMAMIWSAVSASHKHRNFEAWRVHSLAIGYPR